MLKEFPCFPLTPWLSSVCSLPLLSCLEGGRESLTSFEFQSCDVGHPLSLLPVQPQDPPRSTTHSPGPAPG